MGCLHHSQWSNPLCCNALFLFLKINFLDQESSNPLILFPSAYNGWVWTEAESQELNLGLPHKWYGLSILNHLLMSLGICTDKTGIRAWIWELNPDTPEGDVGVLTGVVTARLNACPTHHLYQRRIPCYIRGVRKMGSVVMCACHPTSISQDQEDVVNQD